MSLLLHKVLKLAMQKSDGTTLTTEAEGEHILFITNHGTLYGVGQVPQYLMQPEMRSVVDGIFRMASYPSCSYNWKLQIGHWKVVVNFRSPWQPFAQLTWYPTPNENQCTASAYYEKSPGEVVVLMGPSGRILGTATQNLCAQYGSPINCSIGIDNVTKYDSIVIFLPKDKCWTPVPSQLFTRPAAKWDTQVAQPNPYYIDEGSTLSGRLPDATFEAELSSSSNRCMASTRDDMINTADAAEAGNHMDACIPPPSHAISPFHSQLDQNFCLSHQYYAGSSVPTSNIQEDSINVGNPLF
ncbi:hypothetical protein LZ30DRAFT_739267 [Colletotrichum cereale]|nr:hypothetical protein LZ30DRAFT_739267 [Colletotrichum cereale]